MTLSRSISDKRFILGSGSARRLELLGQIGIKPDLIRPSNIDESAYKSELPKNYCIRMAKEKAEALLIAENEVLLTADTTVSLGRTILGKPQNKKQARDYLSMLSGRRHKVITAIGVRYQDMYLARCVVSTVKMKRISNIDLEAYLSEGEWKGKAGGYALQGAAAVFIPWIQGSYSAIIGLPLSETAALLGSVGIRSL